MTPKHVKNTLKKQRAPKEAQRVKTRGPNPNPTAQAQSKRCLPLSTITQKIIGNVSILASILKCLCGAFSTKVARGVQGHTPKCPQDTNMDPKGTQMEPKGAPECPKDSQLYPMCVKMEAQGATMDPQGHPKCQRDTTRPCKVPQRHP